MARLNCTLARGKDFLLDRSVAKIVGISMGNSYYNEKTIFNMLEHWSQYGDNMYCIFPDKINIHTLIAAICSHTKAHSALRQSTKHLNRWIDASIDCIHNICSIV